jgi:hypothetical protein
MSSVIKFEANLSAGNEIISIYCDNSLNSNRYVMLLAQMQSGKTFIYTFVMCEMFRRRKVENIVVFSGNAEVALREQTRRCLEDEEYQIFYKEYLVFSGVLQHMTETEDYWKEFKTRITRKFEVIWGTALKKMRSPKKKTLFIWDESHFAQDQGMCPNKFLDQMDISPNEDWRCLREMGNYVLSVSATSFSEASNAIHHGQCKAIVTFSPTLAYMGIRRMKENNMIVPYENPRVCVLEQMMSSVSRVGRRKYGIIRIGHNVGEGNEDVNFYKMVAKKVKWDIKLYYETSEPTRINSLECLNHVPTRNTLILVKDHCRMGQQLPKQNMSFVIETAVLSKTDVLLQGLLGRMCGYHNFTGIRICLRKSFVESSELEKYLQFVEKSDSGFPVAIPLKGNNIIAKRMRNDIPKTTGKEVFYRTTEDGEFIPSNGQCSEDLDPSTSNNLELMKNAIMNRIERSFQEVDGLIISRSITSNKGDESTWTGIYVTCEVLNALKKGGVIYNEARMKYGVKIKCSRVMLELYSVMCRIGTISW